MTHHASGKGYPALSHRRNRDIAKRLRLDDLRPELQVPEVRPFLLAYLALVSSRVRRVAAYRARGATAMSLLDLAINQHILTFEIVAGGTRQQSIVDSLEAPRQTVRDGLQRLEKAGLIVRDRAGQYHPTDITGAMADAMFETDFRMGVCARPSSPTGRP